MRLKHFLIAATVTFSMLPHMVCAALVVDVAPAKVEIQNKLQAEKAMRAVPGNASIIDKTAWVNRRAQTLKDMTDYSPGVFIQPRNGAESARLSVRGSGLANTFQGRGLLILQDGIPITMTDGEFEFPVIDPWLIAYAEVFPGANALEYGASNFGGAINFVTDTGQSSPGINLRGEVGSFATVHGLISYGRYDNENNVFVAASDYRQSGFRNQNEQQTPRLNANWGWRPNDNFVNHVYVSHTTADAEIPGAISRAAVTGDPHVANPNNMRGDYQRNLDITRLANTSAWQSDSDRIDASVYYMYRTLDNPVTTYEFQNNNDIGLRVKYKHAYDLSHWLVGMNTAYGNADETRFQNIGGTKGNRILDRNLYATTNELYGQVEQHLYGRLFGIVGAQASYVTRDIKQSFPTTASQKTSYGAASPRVGWRYDLSATNQIFGNLSRSFEPPTWSELSGGNSPGFKRLSAQHATTAEIGTRGAFNAVHWQAAYYHGWLKDEFVNYRFADGSTNTVNVPRSKRDGIELGLNGDVIQDLWQAHDALNLRAMYNFSAFTLDRDPLYRDNTLPGVPRHYIHSELLYRMPSGLSFGPNAEIVPTRAPIDLTNSFYAKPYAVFGARLFWDDEQQNEGFYIEGRNLLNKNYAATYNVIPDAGGADSNAFYPGEGRAVYAGFHVRF